MNIEFSEITVSDLVEDYSDDGEIGGVRGYGGLLDIRPRYQREYVYGEKERNAVINSVTNNFPLNVMYWFVRDDGTFEIIDGQQRTISIARYVKGKYSFNEMYFENLPKDKQNKILDYKLMIYLCTGTESERLDWYQTINIAGLVLSNQEMRNAVYAGSWVSDAKRYFSKTGGPAFQIGKDYITGRPIRQEFLETAIKWISDGEIQDYMGKHHHDQSAEPLWNYYQSVIKWVEANFIKYRSPMKGVSWGTLYNTYKNEKLDPVAIEEETARLVLDRDVQRKAGIYPYILTRDETNLNIRSFDEAMKLQVYEEQSGKCKSCNKWFDLKKMEADHITPWSEGGKTNEENCQMLCKKCNREKSNK